MSYGARSDSRKGLMLRCQRIAHELFRDWRPHRGDWQPSAELRARTKREIADLRTSLDRWESKL